MLDPQKFQMLRKWGLSSKTYFLIAEPGVYCTVTVVGIAFPEVRRPRFVSMYTLFFLFYFISPRCVARLRQKGVTIIFGGCQKGVQKKVSPPFWKMVQMCGGYALAWDILLDCCSFFIQILDPWKVKECIWDSNKGVKRCPSSLIPFRLSLAED